MEGNSKKIVVTIIIFLGLLLGVSYAVKGAADTFALFTLRAAMEIKHDGKVTLDKPIYNFALTEHHQGLEFLLATILIITGIPGLELIYLPIGSVLYSFGIALLLFSIIHSEKIGTLKLLMAVVAIIAVTFSGGGYVQPFYTIFHQSWGFYLMFVYIYVLLSENAKKTRGRLMLILIFIATGLVYYTVNNWLLFFNIAIFFFKLINRFKPEKTKVKFLELHVVSENFLLFSVIIWWLFNTITSQNLLIRVLKQPNQILSIFDNLYILFKREHLPPSVVLYPQLVGIINTLIIMLVNLPILIYITIAMISFFKPNRNLVKLSSKNLNYITLLYLVIITSDVVGYGLLGGSYVFVRHFYLHGTFISSTILLNTINKINFKRYLQKAFFTWTFLLLILSIIRYPYLTNTVADQDVKLQQNSLRILNSLYQGEIICSYKTIAILTFSLNDASAHKFRTFLQIFDSEESDYNICDVRIGEFVIVSTKDWNSFVMVQEWKVLPPVKIAYKQLENYSNLISSSGIFSIWVRCR